MPNKLIKLSGSLLQLASVQIDPCLGRFDVQAGIFSLQGNMPFWEPARTITVFGGAPFNFLPWQ